MARNTNPPAIGAFTKRDYVDMSTGGFGIKSIKSARYSKTYYEDAVRIICETDEAMEAAGIDQATRDTMCECMRARFALLFAQDNSKFDSFRFSNAARRSGQWEPGAKRKLTFEG